MRFTAFKCRERNQGRGGPATAGVTLGACVPSRLPSRLGCSQRTAASCYMQFKVLPLTAAQCARELLHNARQVVVR